MITSDDICTAIRARLPANEYALFFEVRNAAGFSANRSCDAMAMSLWPSRGLNLFGFEVKVSRSDWMRELKNPAKAEAIARYCDYWVVVAPAGIVAPSELPDMWGLWELGDSGKWKTPVIPKKLEPVPLDRSFVAALLRRAAEANDRVVNAMIDKERNDERTKFSERVDERVKQRVEHSTREHETLRRRVEDFEKAAGIKIDDWTAGGVGRAVAIVLARGEDRVINDAKRLRDKLGTLIEGEEVEI